VQAEIADLFGLPIGSVRIVVGYLGGGFGSKSYTKLEPLTVALARKAGRPGADRQPGRGVDGHLAPPRHARLDAARPPTPDGELLSGARCASGMDMPAPTPTTGRGVDRHRRRRGRQAPTASRGLGCRPTASNCNTPPSGSYRAFGATHLQWIGESQLEELARQAGVDPLELRAPLAWCCPEPVRPDGSGKPLDADLIGDRRARRRGGRLGRAAAARGRPRVSWPVGAGATRVFAAPRCGCASDGSAGPLRRHDRDGPGPATLVMAQTPPRSSACRASWCACTAPTRAFTPYDRSTGASRSTTVAGLAVKRAAEGSPERLRETAGRASGTPTASSSSCADGHASYAGEEISFRDLIAKRFGFRGGRHRGRPRSARAAATPAPTPRARHFWEVCVAGAEVGGRPRHGVITVLRTADRRRLASDQPQLVERQDEGATMQGIGNAAVREMRIVDGEVSTTRCSNTASRGSPTCPAR